MIVDFLYTNVFIITAVCVTVSVMLLGWLAYDTFRMSRRNK